MIDRNLKNIIILLGLSYVFFFIGNGIISLTNPDEVFYVQTAKEMVAHQTWMTPYLFGAPQFEKPIFLYWLLRVSFLLFGPSSFGARFFPAIFASLGVVAVYFLSLFGFKNERKAFLISLVLMSCGFYIGMARTVFTDLIFSVLILFSLASFYWGFVNERKKGFGLILFFAFSGLAVLTKGPLGFIIPALTIVAFLLFLKKLKYLFCRYSFYGILLLALISLPWYILMLKKYGAGFTHEFFVNDHLRRLLEAEHANNDTWLFYPASMIGCMFPWSLFLVAALGYFLRGLKKGAASIYLFLACWISVVFVIFQVAHSKLVSYILPLFPALAVIAGDYIDENISGKVRSKIFLGAFFATVCAIILLPPAVFFATFKFSSYISSKLSVYVFLSLFSAYLISILYFLIRKNFKVAIFFLSFLMPAILFIVPFIHRDIEPYVSSKDTCEYLLKNYKIDNAILCSKFFVRGVKYYTGKDVVTFNPYAENFFSPHPIPFFDVDESARDFLKKQSVTYCVLKKSSLEDIKRIVGASNGKYTLLKQVGIEYIVKVEYPNIK